jgi:hypothetical protein
VQNIHFRGLGFGVENREAPENPGASLLILLSLYGVEDSEPAFYFLLQVTDCVRLSFSEQRPGLDMCFLPVFRK